MKRQVLTLSGMTTAGKSTFADKLKETGCFEEVTSFTTRPPRPGEINGEHYNFISKEEAISIINKGEAVDYTNINGNYYGNDKSAYDAVFDKGKVPIVVCDPQGPINIHENKDVIDADVFAVFIDAEPDTLASRMFDRMSIEQEYINQLMDHDEDAGIAYQDKYVQEYTKRLMNMSNFNEEDTKSIMQMIDGYTEKKENNARVNAIEFMKIGISSEDSKEFKWKTAFDYSKVVDAEYLEANNDKAIKEFQKELCDIGPKKEKGYSMSM